ncbi:cupin domain-containing protein [Lysinibacillus sp. Ag94]|uniref:cupin domain-containing protein n=1 Tax=Lysinibacillus sp. Ag94 TaxID=2936682 RepID=UPI00200E9416|nr:cupin domain-containing protein [Lysinibacillus sp. Ag94]UPW82029.1 cupin domain-containing protein [Lysinibacillus sp. Ag94]
MFAKTVEVNHDHHHAQQFFVVLSGTATMDIDGERMVLQKNEGIAVPPLKPP